MKNYYTIITIRYAVVEFVTKLISVMLDLIPLYEGHVVMSTVQSLLICRPHVSYVTTVCQNSTLANTLFRVGDVSRRTGAKRVTAYTRFITVGLPPGLLKSVTVLTQ